MAINSFYCHFLFLIFIIKEFNKHLFVQIMKRIITGENYLQLQEINDNGEYNLQKGFALAGLTYKIENKNIKFYLKEDYFYKNAVWSADIPLNINGVEYDIDEIAEAMGKLFDPSNIGVKSVNGMQGDITLTASDVNAYNKAQVDNLIEQEATARQNGDNTLQTNLTNEVTRATGVENGLQSQINDLKDKDIDLQQQITDLSEASGNKFDTVDEKITNIKQDITNINEEITQLGDTLNQHTTSITNIEGDIQTINNNIDTIETRVEALETDNTTNKADIQTLKDEVSALKQRVSDLETAARNHLVASNIKSGTNIRVDVNGNDVTINTTGIATSDSLQALEQQVNTNTNNIANEITNRTNADNSILTTLSGKAEQSSLDNVKAQSEANKTAIEGIQEELASKEHFKGYFATNSEIQSLSGTTGDFAYSAESGTKWAYNTSWTNTNEIVPDKTVEKATTNPLMDGVATIGSSNKYAAADHIHPTDTSRASQSDFSALSQQVSTNTTAIGQKANQSDLNTLSSTVDGHTTSIATNASAIQTEKDRALAAESALSDRINTKADASSLNNYYTKEETYNKTEIDQAIANVDISDELANYYTKSETYNKTEIDQAIANVDISGQLNNYYTKTESDNKFQVKFADVDDIQLVNELPAEPVARILYLIPAQNQ